jgi:hypothetical protein
LKKWWFLFAGLFRKLLQHRVIDERLKQFAIIFLLDKSDKTLNHVDVFPISLKMRARRYFCGNHLPQNNFTKVR